MSRTILAEGAEAKIYLGKFNNLKCIVKERISKKYRAKELDNTILNKRIKSEVRILNLLNKMNINCPKVYNSSDRKIFVEYLNFKESKEYVNNNKSILKIIAKDVFKMHSANIIHGDLTLCNILYDPKNKKPYFIDFGLSYTSNRLEDKAMDLEVLREIIIADFSENHWKTFENEYKKLNSDVIKHMEKIQRRKKYLS